MKSVILAAALVFLAGQANAASLNLVTQSPAIEATASSFDYFTFGPDGDISSFSNAVDMTTGVAVLDPATVTFGLDYDLSDPINTANGFLDVIEDGGFDSALFGTLRALGFYESTIEMLFDVDGGTVAGAFGGQVLMTIGFSTATGANPLDFLNDGDAYGVSIRIADVPAVPLPAGLVLLVSGLLGLGAIRGRTIVEGRFPKET